MSDRPVPETGEHDWVLEAARIIQNETGAMRWGDCLSVAERLSRLFGPVWGDES